jgi:hypothetical protein
MTLSILDSIRLAYLAMIMPDGQPQVNLVA